jgi:hypothetical protein
MTRAQITAGSVAAFALLAQILSGSGIAEMWAALFWISAMGNAVLLMLWYNAREKHAARDKARR